MHTVRVLRNPPTIPFLDKEEDLGGRHGSSVLGLS